MLSYLARPLAVAFGVNLHIVVSSTKRLCVAPEVGGLVIVQQTERREEGRSNLTVIVRTLCLLCT